MIVRRKHLGVLYRTLLNREKTMLVSIHNPFLRVTAQTGGAELQSVLAFDGTEYLWQGDPAYWEGRSPTLFPYVARLTNGTYYLDGNAHQMRIHGFAPYSEFRLTHHTDTEMAFELSDTSQTYAEFPRSFRFRITYRLQKKTLFIGYEVINTDDRILYFGLGGHPGFRVPTAEGKTFDSYRLRFSEPSEPVRIGFSEDCFLNGADTEFNLKDGMVLPLRHNLFNDDAIVLKNIPKEVVLETDDDEHTVTVRYPQMPYLGLWHAPKTDAPYLCIEPWCSLPSKKGEEIVFEEKEDLIRVLPKKQYFNEWSIIFGMPQKNA